MGHRKGAMQHAYNGQEMLNNKPHILQCGVQSWLMVGEHRAHCAGGPGHGVDHLADAALELAGNLRHPQARVLGRVADGPLRAELLRQEARLACTPQCIHDGLCNSRETIANLSGVIPSCSGVGVTAFRDSNRLPLGKVHLNHRLTRDLALTPMPHSLH